MRVLMVSPYPPLRDGVGKYAAQEVAALRVEGHDVDVLAPVACAAHFVVDFKRGRGLMKLRRYARRYDRVVLQYQPAHYHGRGSGLRRVVSNFWMLVAYRSIRNLTIVCHEIEYPPSMWPRWRPEVVLERLAWKGARQVAFHTEHEVVQMRERYGVEPRTIVMRPHGAYFRAAVAESRAAARRRLELDPEVRFLLCIGFIQPHKGFDRAVRAFRRVPGNAKLAIVGSIRAETLEHRAYLHELKELASPDARIEVREGVLSDEEFDRWILACDAVLLPYREIWSSGVLERARVLGRPVIAVRAGGMAEQTRPGDVLVADDEELAHAIAGVVGEGPPETPVAMTVTQAMAFLEEESARRKQGAGGHSAVERSLRLLESSRGVRPVILPSERRGIGPILDLAKRVIRRALGWLLTPLLGQINEFERLTIDAIEAVVAEVRGRDPSEYSVFNYSEFEEQFRGSSDTIKEKQRAYVKDFVGHEPVLDVGCGSGEFLELLREEGVEATGIDLSLDMVTKARSKGLRVEFGDGVTYLGRLRPGSLGGVFASQVVEHMSPRTLLDLLRAARHALRGGGVLVCETINPESLYALANWYFMDLTHAQPIHPRTLRFLAEEVGFVDAEVRYLSPVREERDPVPVDDDAPAWSREVVRSLDDELRTIGDFVFGPQDYALIARVP